ncbi:MAG: aminotransferase class V-fold PLP-dependent enzyme [Pseudomonadota bacterium]
MSLTHGYSHLAMPGPTVIPDRVLQAMHRPSPDIYSGELVDGSDQLYQDLAGIAQTSHDTVIFIGNGHAAWEGALVNTLAPGERVLALYTGRFGRGWAAMAEALGIEVQPLDFGIDKPVDPQRVGDALREDVDRRIKAVITVHTDTSTSIRNHIESVRTAIDASGHPALLMVDCIASLGCEPYYMDDWGVDVTVAACQKGLMTPPGLAFNFVGPRAREKRNTLGRVSSYWDWNPRLDGEHYYQKFCGTPPTHHLFGLREALNMLAEEGIENTWQRHTTNAKAVWAAADAWSKEGSVRLHIADTAHRSTGVTTLQAGDGNGPRIRAWCIDEVGVTLGFGLPLGEIASARPDNLFRIGHMGHVTTHALLGSLGCIEAALSALKIPHGAGALAAATEVIATAGPD